MKKKPASLVLRLCTQEHKPAPNKQRQQQYNTLAHLPSEYALLLTGSMFIISAFFSGACCIAGCCCCCRCPSSGPPAASLGARGCCCCCCCSGGFCSSPSVFREGAPPPPPRKDRARRSDIRFISLRRFSSSGRAWTPLALSLSLSPRAACGRRFTHLGPTAVGGMAGTKNHGQHKDPHDELFGGWVHGAAAALHSRNPLLCCCCLLRAATTTV